MAIEEPLYLTEASLEYPETAIKALTDESVRLLQNAAYKVLVHGLGVHRTDLESEKHLRDILTEPRGTQIDIDREYHTKIKTIYSRILEYATELQAKFSLEEKDLEQIRNILIADRLLVQVVKRMKPLHANIERYLEADNEAIRHEYNTLRRNILKVVRAIKKIGLEGISQEDLETLHHRRGKAKQMDVLLSGRVSELLKDKAIKREMASSLINDSSNASRIAKNLVDIATMLYKPQDKTVNAIDEQNAREFTESETPAVEPVSAVPLEGIDEPKP